MLGLGTGLATGCATLQLVGKTVCACEVRSLSVLGRAWPQAAPLFSWWVTLSVCVCELRLLSAWFPKQACPLLCYSPADGSYCMCVWVNITICLGWEQACPLTTPLCSYEVMSRIVCQCMGGDHYLVGFCKRVNHWLRHCSASRCRVALSVRLVVVTVCLPCWVFEGIAWNSLTPAALTELQIRQPLVVQAFHQTGPFEMLL